MSKKRFLLFAFIIVIIVIFGYMNKLKDIEEEAINPDEHISEEDLANMTVHGLGEEASDQDISDWQVYRKESKNILFKFHKDWYYSRDSQIETDSDYDLYVGFADNPEALEKKPPYPVEFGIVPLALKSEYIKNYAYERGIEKDGNYYYFGTIDKDAYSDVVLAMAGSLEFLDKEVMTKYSDDNIEFSYLKLWSKPKLREIESDESTTTPEWVLDLGLKGRTMCSSPECPVFSFSGYTGQDKDELVNSLREDQSINIRTEGYVNDNQMLVFESEAVCSDLGAYIFDGSDSAVMVKFEARCGAADENLEQAFEKILGSFDFINKE